MAINSVSDIKIIITGGASGIGAATAKLLAQDGAHVMIADVDEEGGKAVAEKLGKNVIFQKLDVTNADEWKAAVKVATDVFGGLNCVFNNAGIVGFGGVDECKPEDFKRIMDINLNGVYLGIHCCAEALKKAGGGVIVNTSSTAGLIGYGRLAGYTASKWAVRGLTKAAAIDLAKDGTRVVSIHPGGIETPMTEGLDNDASTKAQAIPRLGKPEEVAKLARYLFTEATFSTGSEFIIDGGTTAGQTPDFPDS